MPLYASLRHCAVLRSQTQQQRNEAVAKNRPLLTGKSGFTDTDPCNGNASLDEEFSTE
jgi:hypothetical protein